MIAAFALGFQFQNLSKLSDFFSWIYLGDITLGSVKGKRQEILLADSCEMRLSVLLQQKWKYLLGEKNPVAVAFE